MIPKPLAKDLIEKLEINPFIDGPTEALVKRVVANIIKVPEFKYIFGTSFDTYERFDYAYPQLPALRVYCLGFRKEADNGYITGMLNVDILYPANIRREETQYFQDVLCAALVQQFRRQNFFQTLVQEVPGLNQLGFTIDVNKEMGMVWEDDILPMTKTLPNFRIDLKRWDDYLESTGRTTNDPFNVTLKNLKTIFARIVPTRDDGSEDLGAETDIQVDTGEI